MANQGVEALSTVLATYQKGANVTQTVAAAATAAENGGSQNAVNASLAAAQLVDSAVSSIGKNLPAVINTVDGKIPVAGVVLSTASALNNAQQVINALPSGKIPQSQAIGAIGDAAGAIGGAALALAAVAAGTPGAIAFVATLGAALTVASVGLTIASVAVGRATWDVPDILKDATDGLNKLRDTLGDAFDSAYESIKDTVSDFLSDAGDFVEYLKDRGFDNLLKDASDFWIPKNIKDWWDRAKNWTWPRDPIILDLDGDGLETIGLASSNVYFDFDADGVLTKTGWSGKDDALLVWDRNANGNIDTGAELFGDFTVLPNGTLAPNGFAALAALDSNGDGILDASDPAFAELKLWRDADQNGHTGSGELISLLDAGIVSLDLAHTLKNQGLANGNVLSREGRFTRADGSTSAMGEFRLATDTFDTRFAEAIDVPEDLKSLPTLGGTGNVRELQQAAAQSGSLASLLAQFQSATTRAEQKALLDSLLTAWADTSGMAKSLEERAAGKYRIQYDAFGNERRSSSIDTAAFAAISSGSVGGDAAALLSDAGGLYLTEHYRNLIAEQRRKLHVLEAFNGQYFFNLPTQKSQTDGANWGLSISAGSGGGSGGAAMALAAQPTLLVNYSQPQLDLLQQAYDSLKESVYASLVLQTRLKPYLDAIELVIDEQGLRLDATGLNQTLAAKKAADPENYLADLLDLDRYAGGFLTGTNWTGLTDFDTLIDTLPQTAGIAALLDEFKVRRLTGGDDNAYLTDRADIVLAGRGKSRRWRDGACANDAIWRVAA